MPLRRELYPADWEAISLRIRRREDWHCKFCGVAQASVNPRTGSIVYLSVAHLGVPKPDGSPGDPHDKMDCRDENLAALCQRCHLNYDRKDHLLNMAWRRIRARLAAGQLWLFPQEDDDGARAH